MSVSVVITHADPAEFMLASSASYVRATTVLTDHYTALRTGFSGQKLPYVVGETHPSVTD